VVDIRYPGDFPEGFTWVMADEAYAAAKKIREFVMAKIVLNLLVNLQKWGSCVIHNGWRWGAWI
jgi:hypothetical protein